MIEKVIEKKSGMPKKIVLITAPSLDTKQNVSGISSVVNFIIINNSEYLYRHFELGRKDKEKRNLLWFLGILKTSFKWMFIVTSKKVNLIHFNFALCTASILRDVPLILFAKLIRKKMIIHLHGGEYLIEKKAPGWMRFFLKMVFTNKTQVLVLSPVEQKVLCENYNINSVKALPNCVDLKEAKNFERQFDSGKPLQLLFMGRIRVDKGIAFIYQAATILKSKQIPFKFFMAGAGPDELEYTQKFAQLLGDDFEFKGVVSGEAKINLLKECDIFLLPSFFPEGLPMALLETMSFGLVPIVSGIGSIKYVVNSEENGIIVEKNPGDEVASAIISFERNRSQVKVFSNNARQKIFTDYDPDKYIIELNKIYDVA